MVSSVRKVIKNCSPRAGFIKEATTVEDCLEENICSLWIRETNRMIIGEYVTIVAKLTREDVCGTVAFSSIPKAIGQQEEAGENDGDAVKKFYS